MKRKGPYSAAFTGCGFMLDEIVALLPLLRDPNADALLKAEVEENRLLSLGKAKTRARMMNEFKRRFNAVPRSFWNWFVKLDRESQTGALFYVLLKTYYLLMDFQLNVVRVQARSARPCLLKTDLALRLNEIAASDEFVESWSEETKSRVCSGCLSFLRAAGMLDAQTGQIVPLRMRDEDFAYFLEIGEGWFLEAGLLQPFEIERIKETVQ